MAPFAQHHGEMSKHKDGGVVRNCVPTGADFDHIRSTGRWSRTPTDKPGKKIRWNFNALVGLSNEKRDRAHEYFKDVGNQAPAMQLVLANGWVFARASKSKTQK